MTEKYIYSGDVNPEHGGMLYTLKDWKFGYVSVIRWDPCSDAGGPDNQFWVERGSINIEDDDRNARALETIGVNLAEDEWKHLTPYHRKCAIVEALISYMGIGDRDASWTVQIGPFDSSFKGRRGWEENVVNTQLRAGSCIRRYCFKERH